MIRGMSRMLCLRELGERHPHLFLKKRKVFFKVLYIYITISNNYKNTECDRPALLKIRSMLTITFRLHTLQEEYCQTQSYKAILNAQTESESNRIRSFFFHFFIFFFFFFLTKYFWRAVVSRSRAMLGTTPRATPQQKRGDWFWSFWFCWCWKFVHFWRGGGGGEIRSWISHLSFSDNHRNQSCHDSIVTINCSPISIVYDSYLEPAAAKIMLLEQFSP